MWDFTDACLLLTHGSSIQPSKAATDFVQLCFGIIYMLDGPAGAHAFASLSHMARLLDQKGSK